MEGRFFKKEICLWLSNLDVVREHQKPFALMKVNGGTVTWRAPDCVLSIPALEGRTQLETQHIPPLVHPLAFLIWEDVMLQVPFL